MFEWQKLGKLFDPSECDRAGWMKEFAQSPSTLVCEQFVRVYFCSRPSQAFDGKYVSLLSYIDLDRGDLRKVLRVCERQILKLGECGTFDEFGTNPVSVIRDENVVRVYYAGWTRCESVPYNAAIGVAVSHDNGESFNRLGAGPVLSYDPDEPFMLGSPRIRKYDGKWYLWYASGRKWLKSEGKPEPVYKIRMASSADGLNWVKLGKDLIDSRLGENECQASPDVTFHDGQYHMFFSYRFSHDYRTGKGGYRVGYASSFDMVNWDRQDEKAGLRVSEEGWDSEMVSYPHLFALDGETYMLYQGNGMGRCGFGLAKLSDSHCWRNN